MKKYKIVYGKLMSDLETDVSELINLGWKCQGGVSVQKNGYYQAMVLEVDE